MMSMMLSTYASYYSYRYYYAGIPTRGRIVTPSE